MMVSSGEKPRDRTRDYKHRSRHHHSRSRSPPNPTIRNRSRDCHTSDRPDRHRRSSRDRKSHRSQSHDKSFGRSSHTWSRHDRHDDRDRSSREKSGGMVRSRGPLPSQESSWAVMKGEAPPVEVEKPNFKNTGLLAAESNSVKQADGTLIQLKYNEPSDAAKPKGKDAQMWKLVVFRGDKIIDTVGLGSKSMWLFGREKKVVDFPVDGGSVSGQHMVFQFRLKEGRNEFGDREAKVKLYVIDLETSNGTRLNGEKIPTSCYVEVRPKDVIRLGKDSTEYVVMFS